MGNDELEKRFSSIESEIKGMKDQLAEHGKTNAVIANEMTAINITLNKLADNQTQLIELKTNINNLLTNCRDRSGHCQSQWDETFTRLRRLETGKVDVDNLEKCKTDVSKAAAKLVKPLSTRTDNLERNQRWAVITVLGAILASSAIMWLNHLLKTGQVVVG